AHGCLELAYAMMACGACLPDLNRAAGAMTPYSRPTQKTRRQSSHAATLPSLITMSQHLPYQSPRLARNNFDLLRLLFAGTVCLVHAYQLSGRPELAWLA